MNKTKLAVIGATVSTAIAIGGLTYSVDKISLLKGQTETLQQEKKALEEELNKSKKELEDTNKDLLNISKENDSLKLQIEEQNSILNDLSTNISYDPYDLTSPSNASLAQLELALDETPLQGLEGAFLKGEKDYGVNAMFLIGLVANESGWGTSQRAREQNNMTGFEVYTNYSRGAMFSTKEESILVTADLLANDYLSPEGQYHSGCSIWNVNMKYSQIDGQPNEAWSEVINSIAYNLVEDINKNN